MIGILKRKAFFPGAFLLAGLLAATAHPSTVGEILKRIESATGQAKSISADFVQTKELDLFSSSITSRGRLIVRPPDLLIWKVMEPLEATYFVDRKTVGGYDPKTGELKRWETGGGQGGIPSFGWFLQVFAGAFDAIAEAFRIEIIEEGDEILRLRLMPKEAGAKAIPSEIRLGFDASAFHLKEIVILEPAGDRTEIRLENVEFNGDISPEIPGWLRREAMR